jgi:hypothetical protein
LNFEQPGDPPDSLFALGHIEKLLRIQLLCIEKVHQNHLLGTNPVAVFIVARFEFGRRYRSARSQNVPNCVPKLISRVWALSVNAVNRSTITATVGGECAKADW